MPHSVVDFPARPGRLASGAHYSKTTGPSLRNGDVLYRLTPLGDSRVARSYTTPFTGETCGPVSFRVVKHPTAQAAHYGANSRPTELNDDHRSAAMNAHPSTYLRALPGHTPRNCPWCRGGAA